MTSSFNACDVTVANSNDKNLPYIFFDMHLCPPLWKRFRHPCSQLFYPSTGTYSQLFYPTTVAAWRWRHM